ncbi:MAG: nucleotidyltransferase substrate binding protein [Rhodocyclaceae bacterium]|nr:nucleotidyltransferase substrate binding protein [Rhodocyclaceae bacterium]
MRELESRPYDEVVRDAAIQRFGFSFEAVWKAAQAVLSERFGTRLGAPKPVIRASLENGLLDEAEARLAMVDHRNLTYHTYNEALVNQIFAAQGAYRVLMEAWLARLAAT